MRKNRLKHRNDNRVTLQQIAEITGAAYRTVAGYAQRAGWTENGVQTLLNEEQATIIIEAMKQAQPNQHTDTLHGSLQGVETTESRSVRIAAMAKQQQELAAKIQSELEAELAELREKNETLEIALNDSLEYFTVAKYNKVYGMNWDMEQCQHIGKQLSQY